MPAVLRGAMASNAPALLELFTSQGCSDCPPANKVAGELANVPGVHVVSFNVDYWDYLGWKDTLAKPQYSQRQMDYAHARGDGEVYTPQMVINGAAHAVGSRRDDIEAAMMQTHSNVTQVEISIAMSGSDIVVSLGDGPAEKSTLWTIGIAPQISVHIARGENAGRSVTYLNVARQLVELGSWNGKAQSLKVARAAIAAPDCTSCLAVLQKGRVGPVLGLASLTLSNS